MKIENYSIAGISITQEHYPCSRIYILFFWLVDGCVCGCVRAHAGM